MKGKILCTYCKKKIFNEFVHLKKKHGEKEIEQYLKKINFKIMYCLKTGKIIIPEWSRKENAIVNKKLKKLFGTKVEFYQVLCNEECKKYKNRKDLITNKYNIDESIYNDLMEKYNKNKGTTLEKLIKKHGEEKGNEIYLNIKKSKYTTNWWIEKYGEEKGLEKQKQWKDKTNGSLKRYIEKFGELEGKQKYNEFKEKCSIYNKKHRVGKFGETEYESSLKKYKSRKKVLSLNYFLEKNNYDYEKSLEEFKKRQRTSDLKTLQNKYGEVAGEEKYKEINKKKTFGFEGKSLLETNFLNEIYEKIKNKFEFIYFKENKYVFYATKEFRIKNRFGIYPDMYIKDINLCIEIFGNFWHMNPLKYSENDINPVIGKTAKEIWQNDSERIKLLKNYYNKNVIIIWENEISENRKKILIELEGKINEYSKTT